eukprot:m.184061 g.184061  ORF g.184061 m.184061 type:complete len:378 (+) comp32180_c1_seq2:85-1218(+)
MGALKGGVLGVIIVAICLWTPSPNLRDDSDNQVVVITGGSRGLGKGLALEFVAAGAIVYITGRNEDSLKQTCSEASATIKIKTNCRYKVVDSANDTSLDDLFSTIAKDTNNRIDVLINNAYSGLRFFGDEQVLGKPFWEVPVKVYDSVFDVGVRSHYVATSLAIPLLRQSAHPLVVNTNSPGCLVYGVNVAYGMGKCAIDKMTSDMAIELYTEGIDIISLWPGLMKTDEILRGSVDVQSPRRGAVPWLSAVLVPFSSLYHSALAESTRGVGKVVVALAKDVDRGWMSGMAVTTCSLAKRYGIVDERGIYSPSTFVTVKGVVTMLVPPLRELAELDPHQPLVTSRLQKFYFNVLPDINVPIWFCKLVLGIPTTLSWGL